MSTLLSDVILDLLDAHPEVLLPALREEIGELPGDLELRPGEPFMSTAWRGRLALALYRRGEREPLAALTVQVQLEQDEDEPCSWLLDHAYRHAELRVPAYLVVITSDPKVAAWAAGPFVLGTLTMRPRVITLVELLDALGVPLDPLLRERIAAGTDQDSIARWLRRVLTKSSRS